MFLYIHMCAYTYVRMYVRMYTAYPPYVYLRTYVCAIHIATVYMAICGMDGSDILVNLSIQFFLGTWKMDFMDICPVYAGRIVHCRPFRTQ